MTNSEKEMWKNGLGPRQELWVKALESGDFKQGKNFLCQINEEIQEKQFCCLGLACHLFKDELNLEEKVFQINEDKKKIFGYRNKENVNNSYEKSVLPPKVCDHLHFRYLNAAPSNSSKLSSLAIYNDEEYSFKQIALKIRNNPEAYFTEPA